MAQRGEIKLNEKTKEILEWIYCIVIALVLAMLFRYFIGTPTIVKMVSMYPTLVQDERLWLNRWGRTTKTLPEKGEIKYHFMSRTNSDPITFSLNNFVIFLTIEQTG